MIGGPLGVAAGGAAEDLGDIGGDHGVVAVTDEVLADQRPFDEGWWQPGGGHEGAGVGRGDIGDGDRAAEDLGELGGLVAGGLQGRAGEGVCAAVVRGIAQRGRRDLGDVAGCASTTCPARWVPPRAN